MASSSSSGAEAAITEHQLTVTSATEHSLLFTIGTREYRASLRTPKHICSTPVRNLALYDHLTVDRRTSDCDVFAAGPCGCMYLIYNIVPIVTIRTGVLV